MKNKLCIVFVLFLSVQAISFMTIPLDFCQEAKNISVGQSSSTSKQDLLCKKWRLFQVISISDVAGEEIDTTTFPIDAKAYQTYLFNSDNTYYIYSRVNDISSNNDEVNTEEGIWAFNEDSTLIGKKVTKYNEKIINSNMSYGLDVVKLSMSELIFKMPRGSGYRKYRPYNN